MNIYTSITNKYNLDIAKGLIDIGHNIVVVEINTLNPDRHPKGLGQFLKKYSPKVILEENTYNKNIYENKSDPDFSIITPSFLSKVDVYIRMMLLTMDRLYFYPLSQHESHRLVYLYLANCYKIVKNFEIDVIFLGCIPHGLNQIALFAIAKAIGIQIIYQSMLSVTPSLSYLEEELLPKKRLEHQQRKTVAIGSPRNILFDEYREELFKPVYGTDIAKHSRTKQFIKLLNGVITGKKGEYQLPQFFLENDRSKVSLILSIAKYHFDREMLIRFVKNIKINPSLDENYYIFFLHYQPEATTTPQSDYFSDQLFNIKIILSVLPAGVILYVKEHPGTFSIFGQDKHFRSMSFYKEIIRDDRVRLISNKAGSKELVKNARTVFSTCGSVAWEAICLGKPTIIFSYAWFATCASCYVVNSTNEVKDALINISKKTSLDVANDRDEFINNFYNIIIKASPDMFALSQIKNDSDSDSDSDYDQCVSNVVYSVNEAIKKF